MKNLRDKSITDQDRKYIVRTLATVVMSFTPHPTMDECGVAAKALVAKYPFLADSLGKSHVSCNLIKCLWYMLSLSCSILG